MKKIWDDIKNNIKQHKKLSIIMLLLTVLTYSVLLFIMFYSNGKIEEITYNQFWQYVNTGQVDTVYYNKSSEYMTITLLNDDTKDMTREERNAYSYSNVDKRRVLYPNSDNFRERILLADTNIRVVESSFLSSVFGLLGTVLFYMLVLGLMMRMMNITGKSWNEKELIQTSDIKFDDVIGHDEILDDVKFLTRLIKEPDIGGEIGAKLPKGVLFAGSSGTGKTLLAKAVAHEADVPFLYVNASSFIEMFVGLGAKRVRDLFKVARKHAPCIIFIDEIDAIGGKRDSNKGTSENDQTINALLQEMDGFRSRDGIFVIAATNRPDTLDEALVRSGRFDRQINVNPPRDWKVRKKLFEHYLKKFKYDSNMDIDGIAKQVSGFTGADIAMICNEASIIAVMMNKDFIDTDCIIEAIDKKIFNGNRSKSRAIDDDRERIAYHEAGHAVMTYLLGEPIARASIQSTTSGVGGVVVREDSVTMFMTKTDLRNSVLIAYAGRASEELKYTDTNVSTGASNDITQATDVMMKYIEQFGFDDDFGMLDVSVLSNKHLIDGSVIINKMSVMSKKFYADCKKMLSDNYDKVELLAKQLLEKETLSGNEIKSLLK